MCLVRIILCITTEELYACSKYVLRYERAPIFDIKRTDKAHLQYATHSNTSCILHLQLH